MPQPQTQPGASFAQTLQTLWTGQILPSLQHMTQELYSYRIWETWQLGRMMDAEDNFRTAGMIQEQRLNAHQGALPDDQTCVAGSSPVAATQTALTAAALTQGFKKDILRRAHNAVGKIIAYDGKEQSNGSYTPAGMTPASDLRTRWDVYCKEFYDPKSNGGQGACKGVSAAGPVMNDDVSVEGFLLRDTIDMNNPDMYNAAQAILINIIQPVIHENISPTALTTPQGQEYVLRLQHLESLRNVAADVVSSIISRRASIPPTDTNLVTQVSDIRKLAGIPACPPSPQPADGACYSTTPSYNEIMLALTKERFFDPAYFSSMESNPGTIQQEQNAIDGYTTVQLQDIYKLQEQINALLAARASLKLSTDQLGSQVSSAPN